MKHYCTTCKCETYICGATGRCMDCNTIVGGMLTKEQLDNMHDTAVRTRNGKQISRINLIKKMYGYL